MRKYVINDVETTYALYEKSKGLLELRQRSKKDYGIDFSSMSNTAVGRNAFISEYCKLSGLNRYELKELKTTHHVVKIRDVISDKIIFKTEKYNELLNKLINDETNLITSDFTHKFQCKEVISVIKKGGLKNSGLLLGN